MTRRSEGTSSFDLFLDTICNTFGGIVFLAILLVLIIQTRAVVRTDSADGEQPTPDQARQHILQLESLASEHATLSQVLQGLPEPAPSGDWVEFRELAQTEQNLEDEISELTKRLMDIAAELSEKSTRNAALRKELEKMPEELADVHRAVNEIDASYIATRESKMQSVTLPRSRTTTSSSMLLLCQSGRFYLAFRPSLFGSGFNTDQVTTLSDGDSGTEIHPVIGSGWSIDDPEGQRKVFELVDEAARSGNIITLAIWPDMYDRFGELRERLIDRGVPYQLWPQDDGEVLTVHLGPGASRIQ